MCNNSIATEKVTKNEKTKGVFACILPLSEDGDRKMFEKETFAPYAKRVYYTGSPSKEVNPNASLMWCEKAAGTNRGDWQKIAQRLFDNALGGK